MDEPEFRDVLRRHGWLAAGLPDHADEVLRIAERILKEENTPIVPPDLPAHAPGWERAYWERRASAGTA